MSTGRQTTASLTRRALRWCVPVAFVLWLTLITPAMAIQITSPQTDYLDVAQLTVTMAAEDATGTAIVSVDGIAVDTRPVEPGDTFTLSRVDIRDGSHQARVVLRTRDGVTSSSPVSFAIWSRPVAPVLVTPTAYASRVTDTAVRVGGSTTILSLYVNGTLVNTRMVRPNTLASMGQIALGQGGNTVTLVAKNPVSSSSASYTVTRVDYPWPTCIIIDKSDFKLYWVRDGVLVKTYPIAIGKPGTPTPAAIWRIDAKYHTDPAGVYGPRKMRLFRQTSSGFTYTAYGIHGTNQEWVIGTMASHGCIRMYNRDVLELFPQVPLGTMVQTRQ